MTDLRKFCKNTTNFYYKNPENLQKILASQGLDSRPSKKEGDYIIITFADKNIRRQFSMNSLKRRVKKYKIVDAFKVFRLRDVDHCFIQQNTDLFNKKLWAWMSKVYLVNKVFESMNDGDVLIWIDSDVRDIKEDGVGLLFDLCNNSETGLICFHNDFWLERCHTKSRLFTYLGAEEPLYRNTNQVCAGIFGAKKNIFTTRFFQQWLRLCSDIELIEDPLSLDDESPYYVCHQHDQSIFSLLSKINNIKSYPLPLFSCRPDNIIADHSGYFEDGVILPLVWHDCWDAPLLHRWIECNLKYGKPVSPYDCLSISSHFLDLVSTDN